MQASNKHLFLLLLLTLSGVFYAFQKEPKKINPSDGFAQLVEQGKTALDASEYNQALIYFNQAADSARLYFQTSQNASNAEKYLEVYNWVGQTLLKQRKLEESLANLIDALNISGSYLASNAAEIGINHLIQAQTYNSKRDLDEADQQLSLAKPILEYHRDTLNLLQLNYVSSGQAYNQYDYIEAKKYCEQILDLVGEQTDKYSVQCARTYNLLGLLSNDQDSIEQGRKFFEKGLQINRQSETFSPEIQSMLYKNIARLHKNIGNWDSLTVYTQLFLDMDKELYGEGHEWLAYGYRFMGVAHRMQEQYSFAREYFERALAIYLKKYGEIDGRIADLYIDLGSTSYDLKDYDNALFLFQKGLAVYIESGEGEHQNVGLSYFKIGEVYHEKNELQQALLYHNKALDLFRKIENQQREFAAYSKLGKTYFKANQPLEGKSYYSKAISGYRSVYPENNGTIASLEQELAHELIQQSLYEEGIQHAQAVVNELSLNKDWNDPYERLSLDHAFSEEDILYHALNDKATALYALYKEQQNQELLSLAQHHYQLAVDLLYELLKDTKRSLDKTNSIAAANQVFEASIAAMLDSPDRQAQAFELSEQYKGILLLESLRAAEARNQHAFPAELTEALSSLQAEIAAQEKYLHTTGDDAKQEMIEHRKTSLFHLRQSYDSLNQVIASNFPDYYASKYKHQVTKVDELQQQLSDQQLLLEYFVGDDHIYAFTVSKEDYQVHPIENNFGLDSLVRLLQNSTYAYHLSGLRSDELYEKHAHSLVQAAHELYQQIVAPIAAKVDLPEQLIIVPDGVLGYVPFELLMEELPQESILFGGHRYLLQDHQISYSYSATLLREMQQKQHRKIKNDFLAFAPIFEEQAIYADASRSIEEVRSGLSALKYNIPEAETLRKLMKGKLFVGEKATEENFNQFAPFYKIIHLATHGKANDKVGDYAYLAFTEIKDSIENEMLYNRDLYNLQLNADMVVLSACETGIGELQRGEGIISLARGFSYAGAKSIITTLWSVNDARTKEIMESFYQYIKVGKTKDAALRQAKLDFIQQHAHEAHPFYWAAFVPVGDMSAIELKRGFGGWWYLGAALLLMLGAYFYFQVFHLRKKQS
ncbi:MAG: CHAT domain-containing tetratricopeptide repeat protein [Bacteroidota bacterium]